MSVLDSGVWCTCEGSMIEKRSFVWRLLQQAREAAFDVSCGGSRRLCEFVVSFEC